MDFGKAAYEELGRIDFKLPGDHPQTKTVLQAPGESGIKVYVGCSRWGIPQWIGKIYPKGTKSSNFLNEYARQFNCIEFNSLYYGLPSKDQIRNWKNRVGKGFLFCPKFTQSITHYRRLQHVERELDQFIETVYELGENLGPAFLLLHPQMAPKNSETILRFLNSIPKDLDVFTEFRHPDWFIASQADQLFAELQTLKRGVVITDTSARRDCVHMRLTTNGAFIRFVGNSLHPSDYERIDDWVNRLAEWKERGLKSCYFFVHQHEELLAPELCIYFIEKLNERLGLMVSSPQFITDQTLF